MTDTERLDELARRARRRVLRLTNQAGSGHVGTSLSAVDILVALHGSVLERGEPDEAARSGRDRFILSKGHGAAGLYAVLGEIGVLEEADLETYGQDGTRLAGHAVHHVPGVEVSTGSLGHGLSLGAGRALSARRNGRDHRVFVLLSDGECDEGSTWEAALFAANHDLSNLTAIVDYNKIQSYGRVEEVLDLEPFADKWSAFGWHVEEVDGHDMAALVEALQSVPFDETRPTCLVAHTIKGKGVRFMEDRLLWHYRPPRGEEFERAMAELEG